MLVRSGLMRMGKDTNVRGESQLSWTVYGEGKYFHHSFTQTGFESDSVFNMFFYSLGSTCSQGKDSISSPPLLMKVELNQQSVRRNFDVCIKPIIFYVCLQ